MEKNKKGTPDQRIAHKAKTWRQHDRAAIGDRTDQKKKDAEFLARQDLRKTVDECGVES